LDWGIYARSDRLYVKLFREEVDLFVYVFIDASASMAFPSAREKFLPASHIAAALSYVVLANHDHVKIHLLGGPSDDSASPFYRGRRRMVDCVKFTAAATPGGAMNMAAALAHHLQKLRRPGKAILISDFLMPASSYQNGLNLLRAFNLDISVIQVLTRLEVEPGFGRGGVNLVDSETNAEVDLQWDERARQNYQARLAQHNSEIRSFCHQSASRYSLYVTDRNFSDFVFSTLPAIGLFK
ncbi:MAG: DUF58 domain-containing protein, partial [Candidatus Binatia bacterium]